MPKLYTLPGKHVLRTLGHAKTNPLWLLLIFQRCLEFFRRNKSTQISVVMPANIPEHDIIVSLLSFELYNFVKFWRRKTKLGSHRWTTFPKDFVKFRSKNLRQNWNIYKDHKGFVFPAPDMLQSSSPAAWRNWCTLNFTGLTYLRV